jgi:pyridoxal phosphate enzyme (YggS family)
LGNTLVTQAYPELRQRIDVAAQLAGRQVSLLAVSKTQPAAAIRELAALGQRAFGENYVQEALGKQRELAAVADLQWHLIGPLQSSKARQVAEHFDWLQTVDREKLIDPLNRFRPDHAAPLNVLIQVNIDDEASKSGCAPALVPLLAQRIAAAARLRLRGLMAIPQPADDPEVRRNAFQRMRKIYEALKSTFPQIDTLSMGMSEDFELAIAEGATMVRIGTAVFGARDV